MILPVCQSTTLAIWIPDGIRYVRDNCDRYGCPYCGSTKADRRGSQIGYTSRNTHLDVFLTLTLDHAICTVEDSPRYILKRWGTFKTAVQRRLKREQKTKLAYVRVLEPQDDSGYASLHIILSHRLPHEWLRERWIARGGGRNGVNVEAVYDHINLGTYLSKSLHRTEENGGYPAGTHRVTTSRGIRLGRTKFRHINLLQVYPFPIEQIHKQHADASSVLYFPDGSLKSFIVANPTNTDMIPQDGAAR